MIIWTFPKFMMSGKPDFFCRQKVFFEKKLLLTREEIMASSKDSNRPLVLSKKNLDISISTRKKKPRYVPLSKRQDRPNAALWLIKNYPELSDRQIGKLVGSTKNTVSLIKNNNYWNSSNLTPKDPVVSSFCSQIDIKNAVEKANQKATEKKKKIDKENQKIED